VAAGARNHLPANKPLEFRVEIVIWRQPCMGPIVASSSGSRPQSGLRAIEAVRCIRLRTCGAWCWSRMVPSRTWPSGRQAL